MNQYVDIVIEVLQSYRLIHYYILVNKKVIHTKNKRYLFVCFYLNEISLHTRGYFILKKLLRFSYKFASIHVNGLIIEIPGNSFKLFDNVLR